NWLSLWREPGSLGTRTKVDHYSGTCRRGGGGKPTMKAKNRKPLLEMGLQIRGRLLQGRNRQGLGRAKAQVVGVIADVAMSTPRASRHALELAMSRQAALVSHKAKRGKRRQPGKPLWALRLKGKQALLGTD